MPKRNNAIFSECRTYRYALWRWWDKSKASALFIGLNPSTADETKDDPTIRRCIRFAKDWGYGGLCMANLFAFRATSPKDMKACKHPVGQDNDKWLKRLSKQSGVVVYAWGTHGEHLYRGTIVSLTIKGGMCLGKTKNGHPRHPLYVRADTKLEVYDG